MIIAELAHITDGFNRADLQGFINEIKKSLTRETLQGRTPDRLDIVYFEQTLIKKGNPSKSNLNYCGWF